MTVAAKRGERDLGDRPEKKEEILRNFPTIFVQVQFLAAEINF